MKNLLTLIFAGMIGGLFTFGLLSLEKPEEQNKYNHSPSAVLASNNSSTNSAFPFDFVAASDLATPAVVHISAIESKALAQQRIQERRKDSRRNNPFEMFGMDDFFGGDIFGRNFYGPKSGTASGVIISEDGYIVTNNHVVGYADEIKVVTSDNKEYKAVKIGTDPATDLAVIKIEASGLEPLQYGDSDKVKVGEWALAVGNPFSYLTSTVTAGIVSAKGRDLDLIEGAKSIEEFIQTDAAVNPGNSGGALVDSDGQLIGINTAIATPTGVFAGYSFAIPSNLVKDIVTDIIENGNIERANLGIGGYDVDEELTKEFSLTVDKGFYISDVENGSGAQFAGLLPGDVVIKANGTPVDQYEDLSEVLKFSKVGDQIELGIVRNGKKKTISVKLKKKL